ncbi:hypothetical protein [Pseudomonas sp. CBC3]|uniref:hypothetical protein n=1 Tax=Pseudomonas sp. CBC3 TaxID=3123318 RepID=UPI0030E7C873
MQRVRNQSERIALIDFLLQQPPAHGPYNACSPQPVRNALLPGDERADFPALGFLDAALADLRKLWSPV